MTARIGTDNVSSDEEMVTVWEAVQHIQDEVSLFHEEAKGIQANNLGRFKDFLDDTQKSFPAMAATLEN